MKNLIAMLMTATIWASAAQGAWVVKPKNLACSKDFNEWGHASKCLCPEATIYNSKIGLCLEGEPYPILVQGVLHSDVQIIGGETTGIELHTKYGRFELFVKTAEIAKLRKANGLSFEVRGEFLLLSGIEIHQRPAIIVDEIAWLE